MNCEFRTRAVGLSRSLLQPRLLSSPIPVAKLEPTIPFTAALFYTRTSISRKGPPRQGVSKGRRRNQSALAGRLRKNGSQ